MNMEEFPHAPQGWTVEETESNAREMGLTMSDEHWEIVRALQEYFDKHERSNRRELTDALEEKFHSQGGLKYLYKLLPGGPVAQGTALAGIEPPAGSVDESFGSVV